MSEHPEPGEPSQKEHIPHVVMDPQSPDDVHPGDLIATPGGIIPTSRGTYGRSAPEPMVGKDESTPLREDEPEGTIPPSPLWAMKDVRHTQWSHLVPGLAAEERIRVALGSGPGTVYVIDDGRHHCLIGRQVGSSPSGCQYSLVAQVPRDAYEKWSQGPFDPRDAFLSGKGVMLCGLDDIEAVKSADVFVVEEYGDDDTVPEAYLPPAALIEFPDDLPITAV